MSQNKVLVVTGPTASGKTSLAVKLASAFNGEIISADSRQVYKGMDIGTGKDLEEYNKVSPPVNYHLIDILSPNETYSVNTFVKDAYKKIAEIRERNKLPIIAGGSPLYIDALVSNYDFPLPSPDINLREKYKNSSSEEILNYIKDNAPEEIKYLTNINSRPRLIRILEKLSTKNVSNNTIQTQPKNEWLIIAPFYDRKIIHSRIEKRLDERLKNGMIAEVKSLHSNGVSWEKLDFFGLEYRYVSKYLKKEISFDEMRNTLLTKIRQFAKSQDIWFRKMENKSIPIYWIKDGNINEAANLVSRFLKNLPLPEITIQISKIYYGPKTQ